MTTARAQRHFRTPNGKRRMAQLVYREVYSRAPTPFLLMTPEFEIIDANDAYLAATMRQRDSLAGRDMFQAFPDNPAVPGADGVANLKQSLTTARASASRQVMKVQRYDVIDPEGQWKKRYWRPVNWPVLDKAGTVLALVHHVMDVTSEALVRERVEWTDILFRRADAACEQSRLLREETRQRLERLRRRPYTS
ncbi:PAS domain-containing protein [Sphingomonas sp. CGMCC 1.13658]|nr:PAS domain-containing protein [Sphingomonas sp. CGMCC 1.13658]MBA2919436.1 PAS domain-containing protein [Sphingomonas sp. CGMCC 1.13658]